MIFPSELFLPQKTLYGAGTLARVPSECLTHGTKGAVVYGRALAQRMETWDASASAAGAARCFHLYEYKGGEPAVEDVEFLRAFLRGIGAEFVCGIGGGSILDLAKAGAALLRCEHPVADYLKGQALERPGVPFVAVPTTAGTGSEATVNSVIINSLTKEKMSIRDDRMIARTVVLDGALLKGLPQNVIAESGMDALTQAVESYMANKATDFTRALALQGFDCVVRNLKAVHGGASGAAADELLLGSYLIGVALTSSRLGVVHGLAHPLGVLYGLPHGRICAACLAPALVFNRPAAEADYGLLSEHTGMDLVAFVEKINHELGVVNPFKGKAVIEREKIIAAVLASGSTKANPRDVRRLDIEQMLSKLF